MRLRIPTALKNTKKVALVVASIIVVTVAVWLALQLVANQNPLPASIKQQLEFAAIYPKPLSEFAVDKDSFKYQASQKSLTYTVKHKAATITVSEQQATGDSENPSLLYYQSLGLRPVTQVPTKHGLAVLVNFYTSGEYQSLGQSGVLAKDGTILIAQSDQEIPPGTWKAFFNDLVISK